MTADSLRDAKWYDGTDVTWTKWFDVPPLYGAWCASLYSSISFSDGAWGAVVCNVGNPYVCKKGVLLNIDVSVIVGLPVPENMGSRLCSKLAGIHSRVM